MKKLLVSVLFLSLFFACKHDDCDTNGEIPACIEVLITPGPQMDNSLIAIKRMVVGNEMHYWLNTGDLAFDGPEYIVNAECDTVCTFCFCPPHPCHGDYENGDWEVIWEK